MMKAPKGRPLNYPQVTTVSPKSVTQHPAQTRVMRHYPVVWRNKAAASSAYPLLKANNLLDKWHVRHQDFQEEQHYNEEDHPRSNIFRPREANVNEAKFSRWDYYVNPNLIQTHDDMKFHSELVPYNGGHFHPWLGYLRQGGTKRFGLVARSWHRKINLRLGSPVVEGMFGRPVIMSVPTAGPFGPDYRYEGKLEYFNLKLSKLLWYIDAGIVNRNEVITLNTLERCGLVKLNEIHWPGICLTHGDVKEIKYPLKLELQRITPEALQLVEGAGGTFVASYLSPEGIHQEMHPEKFPVFLDQHLPDNRTFSHVHSIYAERGFLAKWFEEEGKYSHPSAGRRLAHYVKPPVQRDFPASFEEYERVKHTQQWHLEQPGTGTELPWVTEHTFDLQRRRFGKLGQTGKQDK